MSILSFSNRVDRGSLAHCLSESAPTAATTTSAVTNLKSVKLQPERTGTKIGGGALLVLARTPATFSSKKLCSVSASMLSDRGTRPRPSSLSTDCQSRRGVQCSESTFSSRTPPASAVAEDGRSGAQISKQQRQWQRRQSRSGRCDGRSARTRHHQHF